MNQRDFGCEFAASNDSNLVIEAHTDDYIDNNVVCQDDCLILYTIPDNENETQNFDIVLRINIDNAYNEVHRIHRTNDEDNGLWLFCQLRDKFPLLVQCVPEIGTSKLLLQNISELIQENPSWTTAHIAAYLGYAVCFKNEFIQSQVNISCESTLQTPLHVAVEAQQLSSVMALMDLNVRIDCQDAHGNTPLHLAAITTKDIIQALSNKLAKNVINMFNYEGYTALQLACMADQTDCIAEFLKIGDAACLTENNTFSTCDSSSRETENLLNNLNNPTTSSVTECKETPLHSCETPEEMIELVEHGHDINAKNSEGDTALHVMVKYNRFACSVVLLSHEADVDVQDFDGNTPLHLAILYDFPSLVKALIVFGANVNKLNYFGESPRHLAATDRDYGNAEILYALHIVGAKRCSTPRNSCKHGCTEYGEFNGIPPENCAFSKTTETVFEDILTSSGFNVNRRERRSRSNPGCQSEDSSKGIRVLSLDGGGIRGLILIQMLDQLEKVLGKPVVHCFDFIAGTSTGGILALALATGKLVKECRCLYFRLKDKVFVGARPYEAESLENFLKNELGESTLMGDIKKPKVMITATKADKKPVELFIFRNYESPLELLHHTETDALTNEVIPSTRDFLVWQAARASGAAPTFFRSKGCFIDGGFISNNPTLDALTEIHQCNQALTAIGQADEVNNIQVVVSMGTGRPPPIPIDTVDVFRPESILDACEVFLGATNLCQLLVDQVTQANGRVTARAQAMCSMQNIPYFRLNPQLSTKVALDETDPKILVQVLWETTAYMHCMKHELDHLKKLLVP